ncbi:MAG: precorrin-8X methylmutase [Pseudomonadota bacterium]
MSTATDTPPSLRYERDPQAIYRASFAAIRREADLSGLSEDEARVAVRAIHACGMPDIARVLRFVGDPASAARRAVASGAPVLVDTSMVAHGLIRRNLPKDHPVVCLISDPNTLCLAKERATTRSAAAVDVWGDRLEGAVVVIGNAPTALFRLLERLDEGAPRPAALFAFPVGFVGAQESKLAFATDPRGLDGVTLLGRRGGSAIAAAAFNAVFADEGAA